MTDENICLNNAERLSAIATVTLPSIKPVNRTPDAKLAQAGRLRALTVQGYIVKNGTGVTVFRDFGGLLVRGKIEYLAGVPGCRVLQRDAM
jgi:hypothetical protein